MVPGYGPGALSLPPEECCAACQRTRGCNVWVSCMDEKACGKQCWLKWAEDPTKPVVRGESPTVPWASGALLKDVPDRMHMPSQAELDQIPHAPPQPQVAHRNRPSQLWGWGGSSEDAKPGPRSRRISERIADEKLANEQRTWEKWDRRWEHTQSRLSERFGKPVEKLVFNSCEEHNRSRCTA